MSGCLLAEYEISQLKEKGQLPSDGAFIKSIVSTNLANDIAKYYNINLFEVLTGFKYIGEKMLDFEVNHTGTYVFGFEESYGCLIGTHARDKDAIVASMALCEAAAYYKTKGMSLWDKMYERYGYWSDGVQSIELKGKEGIEKIQNTLEKLRENVPTTVDNYKVLSVRDYLADTVTNMETGDVTVLGTSFGIRAYPGETDYTTLVTGKVCFQSKENESVILSPGEQAVLHLAGRLEKREVNVEEYVGWKDGLFVFRNETLSEIMKILGRWYGVNVIFLDDSLKELEYTGNLERYDSINTFLQLLKRLKEVHYEIKGNTVVLYK